MNPIDSNQSPGGKPSAKTLFREQGLRAKKSFGQCFLADPNIARRIAREAVVQKGCSVLEIGAGTGALTAALLDQGANVVAIERDRDLVPVLQQSQADAILQGRLEIHENDAVACDWLEVFKSKSEPHVVVGNIPYQITGKLLEKATTVAPNVKRVIFMVQKEVADRIQAPCGSHDYGALSVFVRRVFQVKGRIAVPPTCFRPQPSVHSSVVILEPVDPTPEPIDDIFRDLVRLSFSKRRKTLKNAWRGVFGLDETAWERIAAQSEVRLDARPQTLSPQDYDEVSRFVRAILK